MYLANSSASCSTQGSEPAVRVCFNPSSAPHYFLGSRLNQCMRPHIMCLILSLRVFNGLAAHRLLALCHTRHRLPTLQPRHLPPNSQPWRSSTQSATCGLPVSPSRLAAGAGADQSQWTSHAPASAGMQDERESCGGQCATPCSKIQHDDCCPILFFWQPTGNRHGSLSHPPHLAPHVSRLQVTWWTYSIKTQGWGALTLVNGLCFSLPGNITHDNSAIIGSTV